MTEEQLKFFDDEKYSEKNKFDEDIVLCNISGVFWNKDRDSVEIHFSEEDTPIITVHPHPVYFHRTADGRVMKMEIGKANFKH
jgi:hypothetical protein